MSYNTCPPNPFPPSSEDIGGGGEPYVLPVASADTLGGVKVGSRLSVENGVLSADLQMPDFSTTEHATGSKWIDGKEIYRKVIDTGALPNATTKSVAHGIIGLDTIVKLYGVAKNTSEGGIYPLPQVLASENITLQVSLYIFEENINLKCTADRSSFDESFVVVEYTKIESEE